MRMIEFFFDPVSPYAWLASTKLDAIAAETGEPICVRPILFAGLLKEHGQKGPAEIPSKRDYTFRDIMRRAHALELPFEGPPAHPFNPLLALRLCVAEEDDARRQKLAQALMRAAWEEGKDLTSKGDVEEVLQASGGNVTLAHAQRPDVKKALIEATEHAIANGIFGVPTFRVEGELFWGEDRIDDLLRFVRGERIDDAKLDVILRRDQRHRRK